MIIGVVPPLLVGGLIRRVVAWYFSPFPVWRIHCIPITAPQGPLWTLGTERDLSALWPPASAAPLQQLHALVPLQLRHAPLHSGRWGPDD